MLQLLSQKNDSHGCNQGTKQTNTLSGGGFGTEKMNGLKNMTVSKI